MSEKISKRNFVKSAIIGAAGAVSMTKMKGMSTDMHRHDELERDNLWKWSKECFYYEITPRGLKCQLCPNECILKPGDTSLCRNRVNFRDKLYSIAYGNPCAMHVDPIEKKPFYHFLPGSRSFSIATAGCNFACLNCQNWAISQASPKETRNYDLMPPRVVEETSKYNCVSIAYTYSEPVTFYEYVYDTSVIAHSKGIRNVIVSNGYINEKPLRNLCKVIDGATIDLKSFDNTTYLKLNAGELQPVLNSLKIFKEEGVWLEISNLVIPGWSDNLDMIKRMCDWLAQSGLQDTPLHFLRFQPMYKLSQLPPTPVQVLQKAKKIAQQAGIRFVYIGNIGGSEEISTYCPRCKKLIIERKGHTVTANHMKASNCGFCGEKIPGVWS
ncbi:MAG: AmmeMemoRadiSam system radical SAM enzyme [Bacteroidales bacterium]|nr:AmmeMemoRadiSam system radical SAM enzyme [Bacteroidales bacterium]